MTICHLIFYRQATIFEQTTSQFKVLNCQVKRFELIQTIEKYSIVQKFTIDFDIVKPGVILIRYSFYAFTFDLYQIVNNQEFLVKEPELIVTPRPDLETF